MHNMQNIKKETNIFLTAHHDYMQIVQRDTVEFKYISGGFDWFLNMPCSLK